MRHKEKLDYLLAIIHQNPETMYDDLYKKISIPFSWDEYIILIKELLDNKCLERDSNVGIRITKWGRYKLIHSFSEEEKAGQEIHMLKAEETEKNEKMDYILSIINQHPDRIYNNIFEEVLNKMSWKECSSIINELYKGNFLEDDQLGKIQVTDLGRLRLGKLRLKKKKEKRDFISIEMKDIESYIINSELYNNGIKLNLVFGFINIAWMVFNIYLIFFYK